MKKLLPYLIIVFLFSLLVVFKHPKALTYRFDPSLVGDYLRSQDIEDPEGKIKDRIFVSDSVIYQATGYLYAKGEDPQKHNFQHPPLIKYLFGFSILLSGNPFYVQIIFGLMLLLLTYFLGVKLFQNKIVALIGPLLLLVDPVFGGMMNEALLDLGQAVFALGYIILIFFYPKRYILIGGILGLFLVSKFWSTAVVLVALVYGYKIIFRKERIDIKKLLLSFLVAFVVFALTYTMSFIRQGSSFNLIEHQARILRFMLSHNTGSVGGPIILFVTSYFAPWWKAGVARSVDWTILWPVGLAVGIFEALKKRMVGGVEPFFYLLPLIYLLLISTQVPFTRYFILILPYIYQTLGKASVDLFSVWYKMGKWKE
ncbi:MAG TPA: hypothetical protein VJ227_00840 [Patescibacteria group bacterium]|nr:hypothetical protein [Patescibacteria group bacterium]